MQDVRGRGDSEGEFYPLRPRGRGRLRRADVVRHAALVERQRRHHAAARTWAGRRSSRRTLNNPHLAAMMPIVTPPDPVKNIPMQDGAFSISIGVVARLHRGTHAAGHHRSTTSAAIYKTLPLRRHRTDARPQLQGLAGPGSTTPAVDDYWRARSLPGKLVETQVPALHVERLVRRRPASAPSRTSPALSHPREATRRRGRSSGSSSARGGTPQPRHQARRHRLRAHGADRPRRPAGPLVLALAARRGERHRPGAAGADLRHGRERVARRAGVAAGADRLHEVLPAQRRARQQPASATASSRPSPARREGRPLPLRPGRPLPVHHRRRLQPGRRPRRLPRRSSGATTSSSTRRRR